LKEILLPDWAKQWAINDVLLVPKEACAKGENNWSGVDWWLAAFLLLECWHERAWEHRHGPIHSYSFRLKGWDKRAWDRAWVNRIALFVRQWAAHNQGKTPEELLGQLPKVEFLITHDVDAVRKTLSIRLKQGIFNLFNMSKALTNRNLPLAANKLQNSLRFLFGKGDWWKLNEILELEQEFGIRSVFHFHADSRRKTFRRWLFDPNYNIQENRIQTFIQELKDQGFIVGLHPSIDAWEGSGWIQDQKEYLEKNSGTEIRYCRQHWLRFSWRKTWKAQEKAGLRFDTTLMFNDRSGFRASAAVLRNPWNMEESRPHQLQALPSVLMDSHLNDYKHMDDDTRQKEIKYWLDECKAVKGEAAVLWHPHTLARDYGWMAGFKFMLQALNPE